MQRQFCGCAFRGTSFTKIEIARLDSFSILLHEFTPTAQRLVSKTNRFRSFTYQHLNLVWIFRIRTTKSLYLSYSCIFDFFAKKILVEYRSYVGSKRPKKRTPPFPISLFRIIITSKFHFILVQPQTHHKRVYSCGMTEISRNFRLICNTYRITSTQYQSTYC